MKICIITIALLLCVGSLAADVELAVKAEEYWEDGKPTTDWTIDDFKDFWRQTHKGEIIDAFEGSTILGTLDIPPSIVQITVTGVTLAEARSYLSPLTEPVGDSTIVVKQRRWHFTRAVVDSALVLWDNNESRLTITRAQAFNLISQYDIDVIKQKIIDGLQR